MSRLLRVTEKFLAPDATRGVDLTQLTARELSVAEMVASGSNNREIASDLEITERTVKAHLTAIFEKLGVRDRVQLAIKVRDSIS